MSLSAVQLPSLSLRTFLLILSLLTAIVVTIETFVRGDVFDSAIYKNICNAKDGGYGPGRVLWQTVNAQCLDAKLMKVRCYIFPPRANPRLQAEINVYYSPYNHFCVPKARNPSLLTQDAGCVRVETPVGGSKGAGDVDDITCSSEISFDAPIYLNSEIKTNEAILTDAVSICSVERADNGQRLSTLSPCEVEARTPYHACITTDPEVHAVSVGFNWFFNPVLSARRKRGVDVVHDSPQGREGYETARELELFRTLGRSPVDRIQNLRVVEKDWNCAALVATILPVTTIENDAAYQGGDRPPEYSVD